MLQTHSLEFSYQSSQRFIFPDINCQPKETLLILGDSGTGKTTFLNLIALLLNPSAGEIIVNGKNTQEINVRSLAEFRAKNIGIIFQKPYFVNALHVLDNLLLANYLSNEHLDKQKAKNLASALGFEDLLYKKVQQLSGGEQQRVCIARAVMNQPNVILADEPTSALDDTNCERVADLLENQAKNINASLIIVTHDHRLKNRFQNQISL